ncbi:coiled-coil domain-containing protein 103 [Anoplophora glabripennis]|uniref:coiled-coil domain-containing protein 103 n=1 Tax=Anoplophora glabripennis TaxID=217634 RepID=UPI000875A90B|nr:coiled-coil domain-containing protein 103 [Anoplophora glabripennis]
MSKSTENIRNLDMYKELQSSINKEKLYWIRNDAKLRAVVTSQSYDEFRDIVAAAHLKPLSKKDITEKRQMSWNKSKMD